MNTIVNLNNVIVNPFEQSFNGSALDFSITTGEVFTPMFEESSCEKKAVIKLDDNGNPVDWWVVGRDYYVKSHRDFFGSIERELMNNIDPNHLSGVEITTKSSRGGRWGMRQYVFPNVTCPVETNTGFTTDINLRIVSWSGLDGGTANNYIIGLFDGYCLNGCVFTRAANKKDAYVKRYKRNSKNFNLDFFCADIMNAVEVFYEQSKEFQLMAQKPLSLQQGWDFIDNTKTFSKAKRESMKELFTREFCVRGNNVFSLHSAFTNYSSHKNDDLFLSRTTKHEDVEAEILFKREEEITNILNSNSWRELLAA